jgi:ElaB/YqjD/DUF883 family membrane-anchored ribosome-binding protein
MKDNNKDNNEMTKRAKDDIQAIKDDMKDIAKRVSNMKGDALNMLYDNSEDLMSNMSDMKDKILGSSRGSISGMCSCIEKNPMKSAIYSFGAGVVLAMLLRK